jgi:hypothetical protein
VTDELVKHASIVVDLRNNRCDQCKVALHDELAVKCKGCGADFDAIVSNHVGLAAKLYRRRKQAGVLSPAPR